MRKILALLPVFLVAAAQPALAQAPVTSGVSVGGVTAALLLPAKPSGAIILLAGGEGYIGVGSDGSIRNGGNQLVRTREAYAAKGFAVLVPDGGVSVPAAVTYMQQYGRVTLVATSRGTLRAAEGLKAGARPAKLVLTSGMLSNQSGDDDENVEDILGTPAALPPTLVVHHRHDACRVSLPRGVDAFVTWAAGKARVTWLDGGQAGSGVSESCTARSAHGFLGIDGQVVAAVAGFASR